MKTFIKSIALSLVLAFSVADGQTAYPLFQPANGILVGDVNTFVTTPAASSNVISLWAGTCDATTLLRGDGQCVPEPSTGTVTSVGITMPVGFSVADSPVTTSGTLNVTTLLNGLITGTGTGFVNATASDVVAEFSGTCDGTTALLGDGSCGAIGTTFPLLAPDGDATNPSYSWANSTNSGWYYDGTAVAFSNEANDDYLYLDPSEFYIDVPTEINGALRATSFSGFGANNTIVLNNGQNLEFETATISRLTIGNDGTWALGADGVGTIGDVLTSQGSGIPPTWEPAGGGVANPTATVGLTAVNGVATSAIRSDGAPALSQAIAPTWTDQHQFSLSGTATPAINVSSAIPVMQWNETDVAADNRRWLFYPNAETFVGSVRNDANSVESTWLIVDRTGTTVDSIALAATNVTVNASEICRADGTGCPSGSPKYITIDNNGTTCTQRSGTQQNGFNTGSFSRVGNGTCTVNFTTAYTTNAPVCTAVAHNSAGNFIVNYINIGGGNNLTGVQVRASINITPTDSPISIVCHGT